MISGYAGDLRKRTYVRGRLRRAGINIALHQYAATEVRCCGVEQIGLEPTFVSPATPGLK